MLGIVSFTENGSRLAYKIMETVSDEDKIIYMDVHNRRNTCGGNPVEVKDFVKEQFDRHIPLLFIGAIGIAVRMIAPYIKDKLSDIPVVVMDEQGRYVIPILSGHVGGANALAVRLAGLIGAVPVITTATDINEAFAIDNFATKNKLSIVNKDGIARVSARVLDGHLISVYINVAGKLGAELVKALSEVKEVDITQNKGRCDVAITDDTEYVLLASEYGDITVADGASRVISDLVLVPRRYVVGMGCKKGKTLQDLEKLLYEVLTELGIDKKQLVALCSIDVKADEQGLIALAKSLGTEYVTYNAAQLKLVNGEFNDSDFVENTVGVGNVCERSVACYMEMNGYDDSVIIKHKVSRDGVTCAVGRL